MTTLNIPAIAASATPIAPDDNNVPTPLHDPVALCIDDSAIARLRDLQQKRQQPHLKLRIRIRGGGCSGFQYKFELTSEPAPDDLHCGPEDCTFLVDPLSMSMLGGATLRYLSTPMESGFRLDNPQAKSECGCGVSFTVND